MPSIAMNLLLLTALALPVVLFLWLRPRLRAWAAVVAIAAGWTLNVGYFWLLEHAGTDAAQRADDGALGIALAFGWVCPAVLVLLTWLLGRFRQRRVAD